MKNKIIEILNRKKHIDSYAGEMPYSEEEYADMIMEEIVEVERERIAEALKDEKEVGSSEWRHIVCIRNNLKAKLRKELITKTNYEKK